MSDSVTANIGARSTGFSPLLHSGMHGGERGTVWKSGGGGVVLVSSLFFIHEFPLVASSVLLRRGAFEVGGGWVREASDLTATA